MAKKKFYRKTNFFELIRVANLIEILIRTHPRGFDVLLGSCPPPNSKMIHEMISSLRVPMPEDFKPSTKSNETEAERIVYDRDYFDASVKMAGGWEHINEISQAFKDADSRMWSIVMDHVNFVGRSSSRYLSKLGWVAERYGISPRTVTKYRKDFSDQLALMILMPHGDSENKN